MARTYTFTIRKGFRFSPPSGEPVTAADLPLLDRALAEPEDEVVRAEHLQRHRRLPRVRGRKDEAHRRDNRSRQTGFRFAWKPAPGLPSTRQRRRSSAPCRSERRSTRAASTRFPRRVPTTSRPNGATQVVLQRNPNYRGDRPHRFDRIVLTGGVHRRRRPPTSEKGRADYALTAVPGEGDGRIVARYGPAKPGGRGRPSAATSQATQLSGAIPRAEHASAGSSAGFGSGAPSTTRSTGRHWPASARRRAIRRLAGRRSRRPITFRRACPAIETPARTRSGRTFGGRGGFPRPRRPGDHVLVRPRRLRRRGADRAHEPESDRHRRRDQAVADREMYTRESAPGSPLRHRPRRPGAPTIADPANFLNALFDGQLDRAAARTCRGSMKSGGTGDSAADPSDRRRPRTRLRPTRPRAGRDAAPAAPFSYRTRGEFFSPRVGCQIEQPAAYGVDLAASAAGSDRAMPC